MGWLEVGFFFYLGSVCSWVWILIYVDDFLYINFIGIFVVDYFFIIVFIWIVNLVLVIDYVCLEDIL